MADTADWVFESVLQFIKSPLWTAPVLGFIEEHCAKFDAGEAENKLEYTEIHNKFRTIVDELLSSFLSELGVDEAEFLEACKSGRCPELTQLVTEYLLSVDDFVAFRRMMERHNHELELECMYETARVVDAANHAVATEADGDIDDEERFLLEMAIKASLQPADVAAKEAEVEDAMLLEALAMSLALEQERLVREQLAADDAETAERLKQELEVNQAALNDAFRAQREANAAKAVESVVPTTSAEETVAAGGATPPRPTQPPPTAGSSPPRPSVASRMLAPVGDRRTMAPAFGAKPLLPGIGQGGAPQPAAAAPVSSAPAAQPSFEQLKQQAGSPERPSKADGPSQDEMKQRADYFRAQREALLKAKREKRDAEVAEFQTQEKLGDEAGNGAAPTAGDTSSSASTEQAEMRRQLALRLREDVVRETRQAAMRAA